MATQPENNDSLESVPFVSPIHFIPRKRAVGDVMPFFWNGAYHVFYLTNPTGNVDVHWEHTVSTDLVNWTELPPALSPDHSDPEGPEGCCMFTGCVVAGDDVFHAWYTSWNPKNPKGREFLSHATSRDLVTWTKHPEDMIAPDGMHYADHQDRDFRDPQIFWNEEAKAYWMHIYANVAGSRDGRFGLLTSKDLKTWKQQPAVEGVPGDECPDYFRIGETHYIHSCRGYCYAKNVNGPFEYPALTHELDRPYINAPKRVWDGKRHVWFGGWAGGPMPAPRQVYAGPNGLLYMKPVDEVIAVFKHTILELTDMPDFLGSMLPWQVRGGVLLLDGEESGSEASFDVPADFMINCRVSLTATSRFTIRLRRDYRLTLLPGEGTLLLEGLDINHRRACPVDISEPIKIQVFVQGSLIECFIDDRFAQTCRAPNHRKGGLGLSVAEGNAEVLILKVKTHDRQPRLLS